MEWGLEGEVSGKCSLNRRLRLGPEKEQGLPHLHPFLAGLSFPFPAYRPEEGQAVGMTTTVVGTLTWDQT